MTSGFSRGALISTLGLFLLFGCSSPAANNTGNNGVGGSTAASGGSGTGGVSVGGSATGASGTTALAGNTGAGGIAAGGSGTGGTSTGGSPITTGGSGGGVTAGGGAAGAASGGAAGASGASTGGTGGTPQVGQFNVPRGQSAGCGMLPPGSDGSDNYAKHDIAVTGVDPQFVADHPSDPGNNGGYTYAMRNYYVRLPANYNPATPYAVTFGGGGCGNTGGDSGKGGGQQASGISAIQIGLSYVYSGGACFEDGYANTPEVPYFDAVMADISAHYCVNLEKVFVGGYSSGAWESVTLGLARGGVIRGIATGAGGLRLMRPPPSGIPMAAILLTGQGDGTNPIDGPTGSALARDEILMTNGCTGTDTMPFAPDADCVQYTGCPAAFPVVWCTPGGGHTGGSNEHWAAVGAFWDGLPAVP